MNRPGRKRYKKLKASDLRILSIRLTKDQYDKLDSCSRAQNRSMNSMVQHMITEYALPLWP